ncbi:MAG: ATPase, partial [Propionibacteriaceae bacterium]|nr:ATPase [Propionibacteriaceae bacterium]
MSPSPTGHLVGSDLVFTRTIAAPVAEVWSRLAESDRLDTWIGRFEGDPASGEVDFFMTAEGEGPAAKVKINACEP